MYGLKKSFVAYRHVFFMLKKEILKKSSQVCSFQNIAPRFSSNYISPFEDSEVYDAHHEDLDKRGGPMLFPGSANQVDLLIIGGGIMGQAVAYNLWRIMETVTVLKAYKHMGPSNIAIVEKDPTLHESSTALSVGGVRTQFSNAANIKLSMESVEFIRKLRTNLSTVRNPNPDAQYNPQGYLMLATQSGASQLMKNYETQTEVGAKIKLFTKDDLKETFPFLKVDGIELAAYGLENEGWIDPTSLVNAYKHKNTTFPITNITGEVVGFKKQILKENPDAPGRILQNLYGNQILVDDKLDGVYIQTCDHDKPVYVKCGKIINCAGAMSGKVAKLAGIGSPAFADHTYLKHALPVEPRKRYVYVVHCPDGPLLDCPFVVDPSGVYVRREGLGGKYLCGMSPSEEDEPSADNLDVDYDVFYDKVWPKLAERIPAFENLKLTSAWAGYYDYNTFDQNAVIGGHPYYHNMYFLTGFSGHGIQQSCAAARALAEFIVQGVDSTKEEIELEPFFFDRIINNRPLVEYNII